MADEAHVVRSIQWRELFPFINLFRTFRIAIQPSKLVLGLVMVLALYAGGRVLDAIWASSYYPSRGEIDAYTAYLWNNTRSPSFDSQRQDQHRENAISYANLLVQDGIVTDRSVALDKAYHGKNFGDLESKIIQDRNDRIAQVDQSLDAQIKQIKNSNASEDEQDAEIRQARDRRDSDIRQAKEDALARIEELARITPQPIFDEFLNYEARQFHNVYSAALSSNWLGGVYNQGMSQSAEFTRGRSFNRSAAQPGMTEAMQLTGTMSVVQAVSNFAVIGPGWLLRYHLGYFVLYMAWFILMWAIFGGAIARIAAVHFARDEKISVRQALRFSFGKVLSFIFAPVIMLASIVVCGVLLAVGGLLLDVPWGIGPLIVGCLFIFALLIGAFMTLALFATVGGINLMYPTIAVEGSDSFDAISRSFSYLFAKPWQLIFYTAVSLVYGALTFLFCRFFVYIMLGMMHYFLGWWLDSRAAQFWPEIWPPVSDANLAYHLVFPALAWTDQIAAVLISIWVYIVLGLLAGFVVSFYFTANTIIYYVLRREVDLTELDDVYLEETEDEFGDLTLARPADLPGETAPSTGSAPAAEPIPPATGPQPGPAT